MIIKNLFIVSILFFAFCQKADEKQIPQTNLLVNTSHLNSLYEEININGKLMGIIHIYSDYPDYNWIGDEDEGIACVDDASRAAVFYIRDFQSKKDTSSLLKSERLIEFLLFMQSDNGFFYNFIFQDHSINKTHKNSINEPNWWTWRAMWALSENYKIIKEINPELARRILSGLVNSVKAAKKSIPTDKIIKVVDGLELPTWLPAETASDQAAVLVLALLNYYEETKDPGIINYISILCDGILMMQKGNSSEIPYGAFLSWQNIWHAYGNGQSNALLKASKMLNRADLQAAAINEINFFYDYLLGADFLSSFKIEKAGNSFRFSEQNKFSQIAYNFRPMIFACFEAFALTGDSSYESKAVEISKWFFGRNAASTQMYDASNGRCFDGINSENEVNLNSGAESTIEALLSMQMLEKYEISNEDVLKNIPNYNK
jgi:hypothetical protein